MSEKKEDINFEPGAFEEQEGSSMLSYSKKNKKIATSTYGILLFIIFIIFSCFGLYLLRLNIIQNSNIVGHEITTRVSVKTLSELDLQKTLMKAIGDYTAQLIESSNKNNVKFDKDVWVNNVNSIIKDAVKASQVRFYAVINNNLMTPLRSYDFSFLDVKARPWYQAAMHSHGEVVLLSPYQDFYTGATIITIAMKINDNNDIVACDFYTDSSQNQLYTNLIPSGYSYYLTNEEGSLILYHDETGLNYEQAQQYIKDEFGKFKDIATLSSSQQSIETNGPFGRKLNLFVYQDPVTQWYTILTTPYEAILSDYNLVLNAFIGMILLFVLIETLMLYREYKLTKRIEEATEVLQVLGDSYQIVLRVNYKTGLFKTLKIPGYLKGILDESNSYTALLSEMKQIVKKDAWPSFFEAYSISNFANLAKKNISDISHDYQMKDAFGHYKWFNLRILYDENFNKNEYILCIKQVDKEKLKEIEEHRLLKDALAMSHKNEESKNAFFSNMSHDMRTPLNGIIGLCTLAQNYTHNPERIEDIFKKITTSSKQLLNLVDDILDIARPEKQQTLVKEPFLLKESIKEGLATFYETARLNKKSFAIKFDIKHNGINADLKKLLQILNNLVSNSFKYSNEGAKVDVLIKEVTEQVHPQFVFIIQDTGIGMTKQYLKNLFVPYAREERLARVTGTGLGMPIVKNLVNKMGGNITVKSVVDVGTKFTITIPLEIVDERKIKEVQESEQTPRGFEIHNDNVATSENVANNNVQDTSAEDSNQNQITSIKGLNILIAEDNELNMEIATDILSLRGINVTQAWNGQEAVEKFGELTDKIDAILMDLRMPIMDGCEATQAIRAIDNPWAKKIPIIAVTANAFSEDISATHASGMDAHISKPIDFKILESTLLKLVKPKN